MNTIITTFQQATPIAAIIGGAAFGAFGAVARAIRIRRDRAHLHELPDHLLRDIGISRSEIDSVTMFGGKDSSRRPRY